MTKKVKQKILYFLPVLIAGIFIAMALTPVVSQSGGASQIQPTTTTATEINQTMPYLNTNITWSQFNDSMLPNEYLNGTGQPQYINAEPSTFYQNYISVNPTDIISAKALQNDTLGTGDNWANASDWRMQQDGQPNTTYSLSAENLHGQKEIVFSVTISGKQAGGSMYVFITVPLADYPSQSIQYDYLTMIGQTSVPTDSGAIGYLQAENETAGVGILGSPSQPMYFSMSLAQIEKNYNVGFNTTVGQGFSSNAQGELIFEIPADAPDGTYSITLTGMAFTTYPITFGSNATGSVISKNTGNLQLSDYHPDINNVSVVNNGYTEALSQPMSMGLNYTYTQAQLTGSQYIEENTREANLEFPTGSDISYSNSNISLVLNGITGNQIGIYNINGVSYSSTVSTMHGNQTLYTGSVNPNQQNNVIIQTEYTAQQWNSITQAPFFLSVQGIEYYWWIFLIGTFGAIGIFAGLRSYSEGKEENLRAPPKVR